MSAAALPFAAQGIQDIGTGYQKSEAIKGQNAYDQSISKVNQAYANLQADDAINRGRNLSNEQRQQTEQLVSKQKASLAAQGIELDTGTADTLLKNTAHLGELDAMNISNNAWREAWGFKQQALEEKQAAKFSGMTAKYQAKTTLLTGGMQALTRGMQAYSAAQKG